MREFPDTKRGRAAAHTRSKVIAAAADLFATRGYPNVGIRDVAKAVNMSTGAVFSHFKDKDELWRTATGREPPMAVIIGVLRGRPGGCSVVFAAEDAAQLLIDLTGTPSHG